MLAVVARHPVHYALPVSGPGTWPRHHHVDAGLTDKHERVGQDRGRRFPQDGPRDRILIRGDQRLFFSGSPRRSSARSIVERLTSACLAAVHTVPCSTTMASGAARTWARRPFIGRSNLAGSAQPRPGPSDWPLAARLRHRQRLLSLLLVSRATSAPDSRTPPSPGADHGDRGSIHVASSCNARTGQSTWEWLESSTEGANLPGRRTV
jgi:hypothetical protein